MSGSVASAAIVTNSSGDMRTVLRDPANPYWGGATMVADDVVIVRSHGPY